MGKSDFYLLQEINQIISEIESELNQLNTESKKHLANSVYKLGNNYLTLESHSAIAGDKYFAFVVCKRSWIFRHKMTLELKSSLSLLENSNELTKVNYKLDNYKLYKQNIQLQEFDIESLVKIKHFLLSFADLD